MFNLGVPLPSTTINVRVFQKQGLSWRTLIPQIRSFAISWKHIKRLTNLLKYFLYWHYSLSHYSRAYVKEDLSITLSSLSSSANHFSVLPNFIRMKLITLNSDSTSSNILQSNNFLTMDQMEMSKNRNNPANVINQMQTNEQHRANAIRSTDEKIVRCQSSHQRLCLSQKSPYFPGEKFWKENNYLRNHYFCIIIPKFAGKNLHIFPTTCDQNYSLPPILIKPTIFQRSVLHISCAFRSFCFYIFCLCWECS